MQKSQNRFLLVRISLWIIGFIIAVAIALPIAFLAFFNPNDYKSELADLIQAKTHLPLTIDGPIKIKYFPWLGFEAENLALPQPEQFESGAMFKAKSVAFKIPLRALLRGQCIIEELTLDGVNLHLIQKSNGTTNWSQVIAATKTEDKSKSTSAQTTQSQDNSISEATTQSETSPKKSISLSVSQITLNDASIRFEDEQDKRTIVIQNLTFNGTPIDNHTGLKFTTQSNVNYKSQDPALSATGEIKTRGTARFENAFDLQLALMGTLQVDNIPVEWRTINFEANVSANPKEIVLNDIDLKSASHVTGSLQIPMETPSGKAPKIKGDFKIDQLTMKPYRLNNIHAIVLKEGNQLSLSPLNAELYDGKLQLTLTKNLDKPNAPVNINGRITPFTLKSLIDDLKQPIPLSGKTALDFQLKYAANTPIDGTVKCKMTQGSLQGVDVAYYLQKAGALLKGESTTNLTDTKATPFDTLTATFKLHDNVIDNNDLLVTGPDFTANGEGSIFLTPETISYKLKVMRVYHDGKEHPNALPLAIRIKGNIKDPSIQPDMDVYLKGKVKVELNKALNQQIEKHLNKQLEKYLPGKGNANESENATENANTTNSSSNEAPVDPLQEAVEKNIKKGLKKLFKQ